MFNVLLTVFAVAPYAVQAGLWWVVNVLQTNASLAPDGAPMMCATGDCSEWRTVELVLGFHRGNVAAALTIVLIVYASLRAYLTLRVAPLREDEERSGILPDRAEYEPLLRVHHWVRLLFVVAVGSVAYHVLSWLWQPVMLPL